jgi:hypothetical protein
VYTVKDDKITREQFFSREIAKPRDPRVARVGRAVARFNELHGLNLSGTAVTDAGLARLNRLPLQTALLCAGVMRFVEHWNRQAWPPRRSTRSRRAA